MRMKIEKPSSRDRNQQSSYHRSQTSIYYRSSSLDAWCLSNECASWQRRYEDKRKPWLPWRFHALQNATNASDFRAQQALKNPNQQKSRRTEFNKTEDRRGKKIYKVILNENVTSRRKLEHRSNRCKGKHIIQACTTNQLQSKPFLNLHQNIRRKVAIHVPHAQRLLMHRFLQQLFEMDDPQKL